MCRHFKLQNNGLNIPKLSKLGICTYNDDDYAKEPLLNG